MRKGVFVLLAGFALAVGSVAPAFAVDTFLFDPDGGGGAFTAKPVDSLDVQPGNAISIGLNQNSGPGSQGTLLFQANLDAALLGVNSVFGLGGPGQPSFTAVAGFTEAIRTNSGGTLTFQAPVLDGSLQGFFQLYAAPANGNDLSGAGFTSGTLVLAGKIINNGFFNGNFTVNPNVNPVSPPNPLDQTSDGNQYPGVNTVQGNGSTSIQILIQQVNLAYFPNLVAGVTIELATTNENLAYTSANPSACFFMNLSGPTVGCTPGVPSVGPINGAGNNTMLQTDANLQFTGIAAVPEPASLTLLGLGLFGTAAARRRQNRKNASK